MSGEEIYRSPSLIARYVPAGSSKNRLFITFVPWRAAPSITDAGWAEGYLKQIGVSACHFITPRNDWFLNPSMADAIERVRDVARDYDEVILYGSSMGGFGALNFARPLDADVVLSIVPQYSIDRAKVPFEPRWQSESGQVDFTLDAVHRLGEIDCTTFIFYDPFHKEDAEHVALVANHAPVRKVFLPFIGHEGAPAPVLKLAVDLVVRGELRDLPRRATAAYRGVKRTLPHYYTGLAAAAGPRHPACQVKLLEHAVSIDPDKVNTVLLLAKALIVQGRNAEAADWLGPARVRWPAHADLAFQMAIVEDRLGNKAASRDHVTAAILAKPTASWAWNHLAYLHSTMGDLNLALECVDVAIALRPAHAGSHGQRTRILSLLGRYEEARAAGESATALAGSSALDWHWYAIALEKLGRIGPACAAAAESVRINPNDFFRGYHARLIEQLEAAPAPS